MTLSFKAAVLCAMSLCISSAFAQEVHAPYTFMPKPAIDNEVGFVKIFDGHSLSGWSGDPLYWSVKDGCIVGETTPSTLLKDHNNFIVWRGPKLHNFELRMRFRISPEGNSGVNYRSEEPSDVKGTMRGYQFDIDGAGTAPISRRIMIEHGIKVPSLSIPGQLVDPPSAPRVMGNIYEERGRGILAVAGTLGRSSATDGAHVDALLGDSEAAAHVARTEWNDLRIIARDNVIIHVLNGSVMAVLIDGDAQRRRKTGLIGMQVHVGPPSRVEFKEIRVRTY